MMDAITLLKMPSEPMKEFNLRLMEQCLAQPITSYRAAVVDGAVSVTLISEETEATAEDIAELGENPGVAEGDIIPVEDPLIVQVALLSAASVEDANNSEKRLDTLFQRAGGEISAVDYVTGISSDWIPDLGKAARNADGDVAPSIKGVFKTPDGQLVPFIYSQKQVTYVVVVSFRVEDAQGGEATK